ncbi:MAG: sigma-70 family RNA polymerase sigma factor [Prevotella sp.]|nr:sigma-70 family RNA polymerase sigma factor [Prevotella sp.]
MLADLTLVTKVALFRDHRAFEELVHKYQSPVRRFLLNLTHGDEALSDDLAQDTFLKAYQSIGQFKGMASFQTWLMRIAYNAFYDHQRRRRAETVSLDETAPAALLSVKAVKPSESTVMDVRRALSLLGEAERTCITLQMIDGAPIDEIAQITGMPANTVKSHLRRGKEKLKTFLKENGYDR